MANSLFSDPLYTQQYNTAMGLLNPASPQRSQQMDLAEGQVKKRYAQAGLTGSGQELQAIGDTARDLNFNQSLQAVNASQVPVGNWLAADALKRAQTTGDIALAGQALAALGIPAAAAKYLFGIDTTPRYVMPGATETPSTGGAVGDLYRLITGGPGDGVAAGASVAPGGGFDPSYTSWGLGTVGSPGTVADLVAQLPMDAAAQSIPDFSSAYDLMAGLW